VTGLGRSIAPPRAPAHITGWLSPPPISISNRLRQGNGHPARAHLQYPASTIIFSIVAATFQSRPKSPQSYSKSWAWLTCLPSALAIMDHGCSLGLSGSQIAGVPMPLRAKPTNQ